MFIAVGGIDGSGKTTQVNRLEEKLRLSGRRPLIIKAFDEETKKACRPFVNEWVDEAAILFLFHALYANQRAKVQEALALNHLVIADRWDESYLAQYANFGLLAEKHALRHHLYNLTFDDLLPDIGFLLTIPADVARDRRKLRGQNSRFGEGPDEKYEKLQETYCSIAMNRGWHILDGTKSADAIHREIMFLTSNFLQRT